MTNKQRSHEINFAASPFPKHLRHQTVTGNIPPPGWTTLQMIYLFIFLNSLQILELRVRCLLASTYCILWRHYLLESQRCFYVIVNKSTNKKWLIELVGIFLAGQCLENIDQSIFFGRANISIIDFSST